MERRVNKQLGAPSRGLLSYFTLPWTEAATAAASGAKRGQKSMHYPRGRNNKNKRHILSALCSSQDKKATTLWVNMCRPHPHHARALPIFFGSHGDAMTMSMTTMTITTQCGKRMKKKEVGSKKCLSKSNLQVWPPPFPFLGSPIIECLNVIAL